ncbi:hypothetical protein FJT64_002705 [Amphibalanus amphitrite]|uniref:Uncharacterized protein n=1 Tax=Amphibalanus amphitrite TaxID=1232801 RepID=A0A6A4WRE2_AMPAM|nr:hypothetical protein FJT64_002705 [Amphibalanus amphitrite]
MLVEYSHLPECPISLLRSRLNFTALLPSCGCPPACHSRRVLTTASVAPITVPETRRISRITLETDPIPEQMASERRSYPLISFASELGGYLSFVLGVSVMSMADLAGHLAAWTRPGRAGIHTAASRVIDVKG